MCIRDRVGVKSGSDHASARLVRGNLGERVERYAQMRKLGRLVGALQPGLDLQLDCGEGGAHSVSYTHLDVYKRQITM